MNHGIYFFNSIDGPIAMTDGISEEACRIIQPQLRRLAAYDHDEENGLLLRLPCKFVDKAFYIGFGYITEFEVVDFDYWKTDGFGVIGYGDFENGSKLFFRFSQFGENVFLTREEAEAKLAEMEGGHE